MSNPPPASTVTPGEAMLDAIIAMGIRARADTPSKANMGMFVSMLERIEASSGTRHEIMDVVWTPDPAVLAAVNHRADAIYNAMIRLPLQVFNDENTTAAATPAAARSTIYELAKSNAPDGLFDLTTCMGLARYFALQDTVAPDDIGICCAKSDILWCCMAQSGAAYTQWCMEVFGAEKSYPFTHRMAPRTKGCRALSLIAIDVHDADILELQHRWEAEYGKTRQLYWDYWRLSLTRNDWRRRQAGQHASHGLGDGSDPRPPPPPPLERSRDIDQRRRQRADDLAQHILDTLVNLRLTGDNEDDASSSGDAPSPLPSLARCVMAISPARGPDAAADGAHGAEARFVSLARYLALEELAHVDPLPNDDGTGLYPGRKIANLWQHLLLFQPQYQQWCEAAVGHLIPFDPRTHGDFLMERATREARYAKTRQLFFDYWNVELPAGSSSA